MHVTCILWQGGILFAMAKHVFFKFGWLDFQSLNLVDQWTMTDWAAWSRSSGFYRSICTRDGFEHEALEKLGHLISVVHVDGYLMFGSTPAFTDAVAWSLREVATLLFRMRGCIFSRKQNIWEVDFYPTFCYHQWYVAIPQKIALIDARIPFNQPAFMW